MGMLFEFSKMFFSLSDASAKTILLLTLNTAIHIINYWLMVGVSSAFLGIMPVVFLSIVFLFMVPKLLNYGGSEALNSEAGMKKIAKHFNELMAACFALVYVSWLPLLMVSIRQSNQGKYWLLFTMLVVWSSDTFAYFAGKLFGKTLLFETVSPKKTLEGALGGSIGALLIALLFTHYYLPRESSVEIIVMSLTISVASILGDLCESLMKRAVNVKDSGSILPGHGGFLDRFDGMIFALPVMYAFLWLLS
jgi:CDP-diglyceride synthetase